MPDTDPPEDLYKSHEPVFPRSVKGTFRSLKWWIMGITLGIYYIGPWLRWDRGPNLPDQAILIDLAGRRFFFFWVGIWPHEFYFVAGLLIMAGLGLFLFTSALGRVWCGYACPQTVWTDLFTVTERWVEGDRNARVRLWNAKWNAKKLRLRLTKWLSWALIALATGGAWVFYFADAPTLLVDLVTGQAHPAAYLTVAILTATTFFFGGVAREQICIYACPWPRIQAAMIDEETITIAYRDWRGEPRGRGKKREDLGDCIDCNACFNVCPVGIDIRDGEQLECITCGLCIDACDDMMDKIGAPRGLIDYLSLKDAPAERAGAKPVSIWKHILRPRTIMYTTLWSAVGVALLVALFFRPAIEMTVRPDRNPLFVTLSDGAIRNTYDVGVRNKSGDYRTFSFSLSEGSGLVIRLEGKEGVLVVAPANEEYKQRLYLTAPNGSEAAQADRTNLRIWITDSETGEQAYKDTIFNGRGR